MLAFFNVPNRNWPRNRAVGLFAPSGFGLGGVSIRSSMDRARGIKLAKLGLIIGVVPVLLWAYEYGPNPGCVGVPADPTTNTPAENAQPN